MPSALLEVQPADFTLQILGLVCLHNCISKFLIINLSLSLVHTVYPIGSVSQENPDESNNLIHISGETEEI